MKKLVFSFGITLVLLATACGQAAQTPAPTAQPQKTTAPEPTVSATAAWDKVVSEAKKEGTIVVYAGPLGAARQALIDAFRQKYGISLDIVMGTGAEITAKLDNERTAGLYNVDAQINGMTTYFNMIKPKKMTVPIEPFLALPEVKDLSKWRQGKLPVGDKEGHLYVLGITSVPHMLVNTEMVKKGEITTHTDLLDPKWRGKIAINDPSVSGASTEWFTFVTRVLMGTEKGPAFMKDLAKQEPAITRDQRMLTEWIARGKYAVALAPDKATTAEFIKSGAPIAYPDLKDATPTGSGPSNLFVLDRVAHPNATKLFVNWILSKEGEEVYSKASGYAATRTDVSTEWVDPALVPGPNDAILGEEYQLSKGEATKLAAEIFKDIIK